MASADKIILNSLVRRTVDSNVLKASVRSTGATLARKGRSRNWLLVADNKQIDTIIELIYQADQPSWLWLIKTLNEGRQKLTHRQLLTMVKTDAAITISQIMAISDCTLAQARRILDEAEFG